MPDAAAMVPGSMPAAKPGCVPMYHPLDAGWQIVVAEPAPCAATFVPRTLDFTLVPLMPIDKELGGAVLQVKVHIVLVINNLSP